MSTYSTLEPSRVVILVGQQTVEEHAFGFTSISKQLEATEGVLYGIGACLEVCSHSVQRRARSIQNGVVCIEVDQGITRSKNDIIDIYREKSWPEN